MTPAEIYFAALIKIARDGDAHGAIARKALDEADAKRHDAGKA